MTTASSTDAVLRGARERQASAGEVGGHGGAVDILSGGGGRRERVNSKVSHQPPRVARRRSDWRGPEEPRARVRGGRRATAVELRGYRNFRVSAPLRIHCYMV